MVQMACRCLIHELATGQPPFIAANQVALARKVVTESPPLLPSKYSPELGRLIQQMLRKKPEERVSVEEILQFPIIQRASWQLSNERRGIADKDAMEARLREEMRRQFEEQLVQAKEDLQRSHEQKLSAMEQAMHIQAHDMRALLAWQEEGHKKLQMELQDAHAQILHVKGV